MNGILDKLIEIFDLDSAEIEQGLDNLGKDFVEKVEDVGEKLVDGAVAIKNVFDNTNDVVIDIFHENDAIVPEVPEGNTQIPSGIS